MFKKILLTLVLLGATTFVGSFFVSAQSATQLRGQIDEYNARIEKLDEEIRVYEKELLTIGADKQTLQNAINEINVARKKLSTDISRTENQISKTNLTIEQLANEIIDKENRIDKSKDAIAGTLIELSDRENTSIIEMLLNQNNLAEFWSEISEINSLNESIQKAVENLKGLKFALQQRVSENEDQKKELQEFRSNLSNQKQAVDATKQQKDSLLDETQNKEDTYQDILSQKRAAREQFERDLEDLESKLQFILDPNSIPQRGSGALAWPFDTGSYEPFSRITQQFGRTADSGRLYASGTHNGVDFGLPTGTALKSAAAGVVRATGNTDVGRCLSYGKWVLVDHENGLSTLYAHLSSISATPGQTVNRGGIIGYSGNTGYSTGPHLHLTAFAREGVQVVGLGDRGGSSACALQNVRIPVAAGEAYLDPMGFLPQ